MKIDRPTLRRVGFVAPTWPMGELPNGITAYAAHMRSVLERRGIGTRIFSWHCGSLGEDDDVVDLEAWLERRKTQAWHRVLDRYAPHYTRWIDGGDGVAAAIEGRKRQDGVDLVEMEESYGLAGRVKLRSTVPVVIRMHGPGFLTAGPNFGAPDNRLWRTRVRREGQAFRLADGILAPSAWVLERTREHYGLELPQAEVIPNPQPHVEGAGWSLDACDRDLILFVGRFDFLKGGDVIVDAFDRVLEERPEARLWFVGPDSGYKDPEDRVWCVNDYAADRLGSDVSRFRFLGVRPSAELADLRRRALVTVVCSRFDNFPGVALEAMALGCPMVVSRVGGLPEIVDDGRNGLLCERGDPEDLAEKLLELIRAPERAAELGRQAARDGATRYDPERIGDRIVAFYERVLARATSAR